MILGSGDLVVAYLGVGDVGYDSTIWEFGVRDFAT